MAAESNHPNPALRSLTSILDQLACPSCLSELKLEEMNLRCAGCGRVYPILQGIPVLIPEVKPENQG